MNENQYTSAVRVITDEGELTSFTSYDNSEDAWEAFVAAVEGLKEGEIAQLIEEELIAAEHNPEHDGPVALDVASYS